MRYALENPDDVERRGRQARTDMMTHFSVEVIGEKLKRELDRIWLIVEERELAHRNADREL